jgi:hypothetical protein
MRPEDSKTSSRKMVERVTPYLVIRARAENLPLLDKSVSLVIGTPPYLGASRVSQKECCTKNPGQYDALLCHILEEAARIIKPGGYLLLHTSWATARNTVGVLRIEFHVFRRPIRGGRHALEWVRSERFAARFVRVKGIPWLAFPIRLYRLLIQRYSNPGDTITHVFSGSGNSAIAALELSRVPILLDLHYHKAVKRRLNKWVRREKATQA